MLKLLFIVGVVMATNTASAAATITLSNLPASQTTATSASIGYKLNNATSSSSVYCRRDSYDPFPCPNPFAIGSSTALIAGVHKVDFYIKTGSTAPTKNSTPTKSYSWTIVAAAPTPVCKIASIDPKPADESTSASINYTLSSSGGGTCQMYCRLIRHSISDGDTINSAGIYPSPFTVGMSKPFNAGTYEIDFYLDSGSGYNLNNPTVAYTWKVSASTIPVPTSSPTPVPTPTPTRTPSSTAMPSLPYPVYTTMAPLASPSYSVNGTITGPDGIVRLQSVADPGGTGQQVYLHRIVRNDAAISGGTVMGTNVRSEKLWIDMNEYMFPYHDYWMAFAFRPKMDEWPAPTGLGDDRFLVMQTHSESNGDTQPPLALHMQMDGNAAMVWKSSYSSAAQATGPQGITPVYSQSLPTNQWYKFVIHIRPGWSSSQSPILEIWQAKGSGGYTKIVTDTTPNDYNWVTGTYPRIGFYKWYGTNWASNYPSIAGYFTSLYMMEDTGQGIDFLGAGQSALGGL